MPQPTFYKQGNNIYQTGVANPISQQQFQSYGLNANLISSNPNAPTALDSGIDTETKTFIQQGGQLGTANAAVNAGVITPSNLNTTQPYAISNPTPVPITNPSTLPDYVPLTATPQEGQVSSEIQKQKVLNNQLIGRTSYQTQQNTLAGVDTAQTNINDLGAQLTRLKNEASAIPLQMDKQIAENGTMLGAAYTSEQNKRSRDNALAALGVSSLLAASQGQLANAQALSDKAVAQKYGPIEEQITANKANLQLLIDDPATSIADKNRALQQQAIQDKKSEQIALDKQNASNVQTIAINAAANQATFKPTSEYKTVTQALTAIQNEKDPVKATSIAMQTGLLKSAVSAASGTSLVNVGGHTKLINDVTGEVIKDLGVANSEIGTATNTIADRTQTSIAAMSDQLNTVTGTDGYINPKDYKIAKKAWVTNGHASSEFDKAFSVYRNPNDDYNLD